MIFCPRWQTWQKFLCFYSKSQWELVSSYWQKTCFQQNCIHFQEKLKKLNEFKLNNFKILLFKIQKCIFKSQNFGLELRNQTKSCHISMKQKTISRRCQFFSLFYRTFCEFSKTFSQFFAFIPLEVPCRDFNTCSRLKIA